MTQRAGDRPGRRLDSASGATPPRPIGEASRQAEGSEAHVAGRVVAVRAADVLLQDATGTLWVEGAPAPAPGAWVVAHGRLEGGRLRGGGLRVVGAPARDFPDPRGEWRWQREDAGRRAAALRGRAAALRALRARFEARGFLEVETPLLVPSPGLDLHLRAFEVQTPAGLRYLATSPEYQMKRILAGGQDRIYQIGKAFRQDEQGTHHEPEFTMVEWYRAFAGADEIMEDTEALVASVAEALLGGTVLRDGRAAGVDVAPGWDRITVQEAFRRHADEDALALAQDEERFYRTLVERVEPRLGRPRPTFVTRWPATMASLARLCDDDPRWAERFEVYVGGLELANGFAELTDPVEQRVRLERDRRARAASGLAVYPIDERFLAALEEGLPPCGGNALGLDRLLALVLGAASIEDVLAIPHRRL